MDGKNSDGVDVYEEKGIEETYLFGTDALGRDIWTRTWTGARVSLFIALLAAVFDLLIGVTYGGVSAYYGGRVDIIMQRIIEIISGVPSLVVVTLKHLFPNIIGNIVVAIMFSLPSAIFYEAFLSFIGLGLQPPYASLGVLINEGFQALQNYPYMMFIPSIVVCLLIFSLNLLADGLRDAVDPKMRNQ